VNQDTRIESVDVASGEPINVTMTNHCSTGEPRQAVVFVGATQGGGPSSECCCDYLNFFTDRASARAWTTSHPHIPGEILEQTEAVDLGIQLFQPLLAMERL
jgi:hypothetical protein